MKMDRDPKELKKRRRERIIILVTIAVIIILTYIERYLSGIEEFLPLSDEVLIFGLININLILIILLIFLIVRNFVKLIFERRRGILGSKLQTKLVVAFVSLSLIPTIVLFLVAIQFLSYSIESWFDIATGKALNSSLEVAQTYYQQKSENVRYSAKKISFEITERKLYEQEQSNYLKTYLEERQNNLNLGPIEVRFDNRKESLFLKDQNNPDILPPEFTPKTLEDVFMGNEVSNVQSTEMGDLISGIAPLYSSFSPREVIGIVAVSHHINKNLIDKISVIAKTSEEYKQLKLLKNPIKLSYIITLFIVMLLITFSATWFGLFLAKGITVPIHDLAEATHEISHGNLDYQIDVLAEDEIGVLVDSFNQMTKNLKESSEGLKEANIDLEQRGKYMETVLRNVSAGVISIDGAGVISTINSAAEKMLAIKTEKVLNRRFDEVLKPEQYEMVNEFISELEESGSDSLEKQVQLILKDRILTILASTTVLRDDDKRYLGLVVVFEDLTQLQRAERVAAWREVARRIAHEIKNPLTPVKLSAERLQRKYSDRIDGPDSSVFKECTKTIIDQVEVLKNMVNEFSRFARMPVTKPTPNDLNAVIEDSIIFYQDAHKGIEFHFERGENIPTLNIDREQMNRVMINILDNAVAAVSTHGKEKRIDVGTYYDDGSRKATIEVRDNGPGIEPKDKMKLFEPYFSRKKSGTGLGLAIVDSIISDHSGSVSVRDNIPKGTAIIIELPVVT